MKTWHCGFLVFVFVWVFGGGGGGSVELGVPLCVSCVDPSKQLSAYPAACAFFFLQRESGEQKGEKLMY